MDLLTRWTALIVTAGAAVFTDGAQAATRVVDDDRVQCSSAAFTTIQAAVNASAPNDTVRVCAGHYPEIVLVAKPLKLHGPKKGKDARSRLHDGAGEAVVRASKPFILQGDGIVIDGFSIVVQLDDDGEGQGISTFGSGYQVLNNLFEDDGVSGIIPRTIGAKPSVVRRNHFRGRFGFAADGESVAHKFTISDNLFLNASILMTGNDDSDVQILRNTFRYDPAAPTACVARPHVQCRPGIILDSTRNVVVLQNKLSGSGDAALALTANTRLTVQDNILRDGVGVGASLKGSNSEVSVIGNRISGFQAAGARVHQASGVVLEGNEIEDSQSGVLLSESTGNRVTANRVNDNSQFGIDVQASFANTLNDNEVRGNGTLDCRDPTGGSGSFGTANTWVNNEGSRSAPAGLCPDR